MSYTEYMRRKAATLPRIISTTYQADAGEYIRKKRIESSTVFKQKAVVLQAYSPDVVGTRAVVQTSQVKQGGQIADSSTYSEYVGSRATLNPSVEKHGKLVQNEVCSTGCQIAAPKAALSAGDWTKKQCCAVELPTQFQMHTTLDQNPTVCLHPANHTHPTAIPVHGVQPVGKREHFVQDLTSKEVRKRGAALRNVPYVEKHHGNDLNTHSKPLFRKYKIPANTPAQLKINDAVQYN